MTDLASLAIKIDSTAVKSGVSDLGNLESAAKKTEGATDRMGREWVKASSAAGKLRMEQIGAAMEAEKLANSTNGAGAAARKMAADAQMAASSVGAQKAGMQQLGYQLGDIATMYAMGAKPMQIFASQSGQVLGAVQLLTGGTSKLAAFLGGPWGIAITVAATALAPFIAKLFDTASAADTARSALQSLIEKQRQQAGEAASLAQSQIGLNKLVEERLALEIKIDQRRAMNKRTGAAPDAFLYADLKRQKELNWEVAEAQAAVKVAVNEAEAASAKVTKTHEAATPKVKAHTGAVREHVKAISDSEKAYDRAVDASKRYLENLNEQIARFDKSALEIHRMEVAAQAAVAPTKELAAAIREAGNELARLMKIREFLGNDWETPIKIESGVSKHFKEKDDAANREFEKNRARALDTADQIADIIGGRVGSVIRELADVLDRTQAVFKNGTVFDKILAGAGIGGNAAAATGGSGLGGTIGGALGGKLGEKFLSKGLEKVMSGLGDFAGPLGAIAGGILGGIIGGLFKKTPKASATVSIIAGEAMDTVITGNKSKLKAIAGGMADSLIGALGSLADELGVALGDASVSVGMRKKKYVVDPTGQGRTKGAGVLKFEDEAEAVKAAIQDAIRDGALAGLSEGFKTYLSSGDVEKRLADVMKLQGVRGELQSMKDPTGYAVSELDKTFAELRRIATATGEGMAEVEELYGRKRVEIAEQAAKDAFEKARPARELEIQIMELTGNTAQALAASRQLELDSSDASLRTMLQRKYALEDEAAAALDAANAASELARAAEEAAAVQKRIADERDSLLAQIDQALGDTVAIRERERNALDENNRFLYDHLQALKDQAAATEAATKAQRAMISERDSLLAQIDQALGDTVAIRERERNALDENNRFLYDHLQMLKEQAAATEAATKAQEEAAQAAKQAEQDAAARLRDVIGKQRDLQIQLAEVYDPATAEMLRQVDALNALDPALRELQQRVWDAQKAASDAAKAEAELTAAREAAAKIAEQRRGLEIQLADILDPAGAEAMRRADALAALTDPVSKAIQQQIYDAMDAKAAADALAQANEEAAKAQRAHADAIAAARNVLADAYERESNALKGTIEKFSEFAKTIREFRDGLLGSNNPATSLAMARNRFGATSRGASLGNEGALSAFTGDANAYLDAARNAGTFKDYQQALAAVMSGSNSAIGYSEGMVSQAQRQLDALDRQVAGILQVNDNVVTVAQALDRYNATVTAELPVIGETVTAGLNSLTSTVQSGQQAQQSQQADQQTVLERMMIALNSMERKMAAWDRGDSVSISNETDNALTVAP